MARLMGHLERPLEPEATTVFLDVSLADPPVTGEWLTIESIPGGREVVCVVKRPDVGESSVMVVRVNTDRHPGHHPRGADVWRTSLARL